MAANVGILIPCSFEGPPPKLPDFAGFFRRSEELGFHSLWVIDRVFHHNSIMDPMTLLTCAASVTSRVRLGTAVLLFALRNPVLVAKTTSTLDYLSGGRLDLGIALGGRDYEYGGLGVPMRQRVSRLTEGLEVMRKLWTERDVTFHGRYNHLDGVNMEPKPAQRTGIPVIMGGSAEPVLKRTGELADGWVAGGTMGPEAFGEAWQKIEAHALSAGRDLEGMESAKLIYIHVDENRERCVEELRRFTGVYYGPYDVENSCVLGPPTECAAKIQSFIDAGAKTILLGPTGLDSSQITRIAGEVIPLLADR